MMTNETATLVVTVALITSAVILWLLVLWPSVMESRSDQGHGRHTGSGVLPYRGEHSTLDHEVEHDEADDGTDDQDDHVHEVHARSIAQGTRRA